MVLDIYIDIYIYILNWYRLYFASNYVLGDYCLHFASNEIGPKIHDSFGQQIQLSIVCVIVSLLVFYNLKTNNETKIQTT